MSRRSEKHSSLENLILNLIQIKPCIPNRLAEGTYLVGRRKTASPNHIHIVMVVNIDCYSVKPGTFIAGFLRKTNIFLLVYFCPSLEKNRQKLPNSKSLALKIATKHKMIQ